MSKEHLLRAIEILDERGWGKNEWLNKNDGTVCALGALRLAHTELTLDKEGLIIGSGTGSAEDYFDDESCLNGAARKMPNNHSNFGMISYNDWIAQSVDDIKAVFTKAIEECAS